jgi:hypothetical protein
MLTTNETSQVDGRSAALANSVPGWLPLDKKIFRHMNQLKANYWTKISRHALPYLLHGLYEDEATQQALDKIIEVIQELHTWIANVDDGETIDAREELEREMIARKTRVAEALVLLENTWPHTEQTISLHQLLHVPEQVYEWNHVRNYWAYWSERYR